VVKPVPESVQQHLDQPLHSKQHGDDDEIFLDEDGEDIKEDVAVKSGFPLRRIRSTKSQQHIVYRRSNVHKELESSDYGSVSKSNTIRFKFLIHFKCTFQNIDRLCGLVVRVLGYRSGGPGSIPATTRKK
jgi:hypothetical protein